MYSLLRHKEFHPKDYEMAYEREKAAIRYPYTTPQQAFEHLRHLVPSRVNAFLFNKTLTGQGGRERALKQTALRLVGEKKNRDHQKIQYTGDKTMDLEWNKTTQENVAVKNAASDGVNVDTENEKIILEKTCKSNQELELETSEIAQMEGWNLPKGVAKDDLFRLMSQYYEELKHRDGLFWKQIFAYFYATLICSVLPVLKPFDLTIPPTIPTIIFPILGLFMACCFLFISIAYAKRLECIGNSYNKLLNMLPKGIKRTEISEITKFKPFHWQMAKVISCIMFVLLIAISVLFLVHVK